MNRDNELSGTLGSLSDAALNNLTNQNNENELLNNLNESQSQDIEMLDFDVPTNNIEVENDTTLDVVDSEPTNNQMLDFNNFDMPQPGFESIPTNFDIGDIGSVPPVDPKSKKEKKKKSNAWFVILVIILILIVGALVFYYLKVSKGTLDKAVTPKDITIEVGTELSADINDYAEFSSISSNNCILNTKEVDSSKLGTYEYRITCGTKSYSGSVYVKDTMSPLVTTKILVKKVGDTVKPEDFIEKCEETTSCTYAYSNAEEVNTSLSQAGTYNIGIIVNDENNNSTTVEAKLVVIESDIKVYLNCVSEPITEETFNGTKTHVHKIGINSELAYAGIYFKNKEFIASTEEEYNNIKNNYINNNVLSINSGVGVPIFDDANLTIGIEELITAQAEFGDTYNAIKNYYETTMNYRCNIINAN